MISKKYIIIICTLVSSIVFSQKINEEKSPKKAALYSAVLPGAGQFYTKKYWKIPIYYSGLITSIYFINDNSKKCLKYKEAALLSYDTGENQFGYTYSQLKDLKEHYRRNRDVSYFILTGIYILNIVDASVNAHLFNYDISDDISFNIRTFSSLQNSGVSLSINF